MTRYAKTILGSLLCATSLLGVGCVSVGSSVRVSSLLSQAEWRVKDVSKDSGFVGATSACELKARQLQLLSEVPRHAPVWTSSCTVSDTSGSERAVTLAFVVPFDGTGWRWWDDGNTVRNIGGEGIFANLVDYYHAQPLHTSLYPLAVISNEDRALCLAVPVVPARMPRFLYDAAAKELRVEFDFGLSPVPVHFPSRADATVIAYEVPAKWAFRQALDRYYRLYPDAFRRRAAKGGAWLPFQSLDSIERPEDFQFTFREVAYGDLESVKSDERHGVDSFVYVEPQTNWRELRGDVGRSYESFLAQLKEDAEKGDRKAQATLVSAVEREDGRNDLYLDPIAWTRHAPFGVNADPDVSSDGFGAWQNKGQYELDELATALGWRDTPSVGLDGVYVDSMEGWGAMRNYRKTHWRTTRYPLTFQQETKRVCLMNFWGTHAFVKTLANQLHEKGMLLMGNGAFHRFWQLAPFVDIPGMEYSWLPDGKWTPVPEWQFQFLRAMAGPRPYLFLKNDPFDDAKRMEEYFQLSLFYGCYPSMFHAHTGSSRPYFSNPDWYNRDRHLFTKYIPLIRKLDMAGWQPVPHAVVTSDTVRIERYGDGTTGNLAFTLHNPSTEPVRVEIVLSRNDLHLWKSLTAREWISDIAVPVRCSGDGAHVECHLPGDGYGVIGLN